MGVVSLLHWIVQGLEVTEGNQLKLKKTIDLSIPKDTHSYLYECPGKSLIN